MINKENKSHIPGIYNYCDRWCERCHFTSSCLLFTNESKITTHQILNNGELPDLNEVFDHPRGLDENDNSQFNEFDAEDFEFENDEEDDDPFLNDLPNFEVDNLEGERKQREAELNENVLVKLADEYFHNSHSLMEKINEKYALTNLKKENQNDRLIFQINENYEIVEWYHMFIMVKVRRALSSKRDLEKENDEEMREIDAYDMNGTAKIAIISIENSTKALNNLFDLAVELQNEITGLLIIIGRLLNEMKNEFPDSKNFVRPGLDE